MRVIAKKIQNKNQVFLTEGFEYIVYGILVLADEIKFCVLDDDADWPTWYPCTYFICVEFQVPADWVFLFFDKEQYKIDDRFKFVMGPAFVASSTEAYDAFVLDEMMSRDIFWKYIESQVKVLFMGENLAIYEYDKWRLYFRMEKLSEGVILDADTIVSWEPPHHTKTITDEEKNLIQKRISDCLDKKGIVYGWI
jgi:hypothetical protein